MIDKNGFRIGIGTIIVNNNKKLFWGKRIGQQDWQFPQGGLLKNESPMDCMYRELYEEIGLEKKDVTVLSIEKKWLYYCLPEKMIRYYSVPVCIGQKQKWFLLRLNSENVNIKLDLTDQPEFDNFCWVNYWYPLHEVIYFKYNMYKKILQNFHSFIFPK